MRVTAGWDSGAVYALARTPIGPDDDYGTLAARLETIGADLLVKALDERPAPAEQDESQVTYAHKIGPRERALDPTQTPEEVERTIRALRPHIGSRLPLPDGTFLGVIAAARRRPDPRARRRPRPHRRRPAAARLPRRRARADRDPPARRARRWPPRTGCAAAPTRRWSTSASTPRCPTASSPRCSSAPARSGRDPDDEWQPHVCALAARGTPRRARRDGRARRGRRTRGRASSPPTCSASSATAAPALPARAGGRAARDGRARAATPRSLSAIACAFGHLGAPPATTGCSRSARTRTPTSARRSRSRSAAAPGEDALAALIELSADEASGVRDWATFALGTLAEDDGDALRDALAARLDDPDEDTRLEAVHGLALRGDARADGARARPARRARARGLDGVWTRHLLAETASHLEAVRRPRGAASGARDASRRSGRGYQAGVAAGSAAASPRAASGRAPERVGGRQRGGSLGGRSRGLGAGSGRRSLGRRSGAGASAAGRGGASSAGAGAGACFLRRGRRRLRAGASSFAGASAWPEPVRRRPERPLGRSLVGRSGRRCAGVSVAAAGASSTGAAAQARRPVVGRRGLRRGGGGLRGRRCSAGGRLDRRSVGLVDRRAAVSTGGAWCVVDRGVSTGGATVDGRLGASARRGRAARDGRPSGIAVAVGVVHAVRDAVAVGVRVERVGAVALLGGVGHAVAVGVVVAVDHAVAVGVASSRRRRADLELGRVGQARGADVGRVASPRWSAPSGLGLVVVGTSLPSSSRVGVREADRLRRNWRVAVWRSARSSRTRVAGGRACLARAGARWRPRGRRRSDEAGEAAGDGRGASPTGAREAERRQRGRAAGRGAPLRGVCSLRALRRLRAAARTTGWPLACCVSADGPVLPAHERRGERAQAEGSGDEAGGDRARETEVAERRGPRRARRHGVSGVSVRHVWHPLPWGGVGKLYAVH